MMKKFLLFFCYLLLLPLNAQEVTKDQLVENINNSIDEIWKASNAPGMSFSVVFPDGDLHTFTRGFANIEENIEMDANTKMLGGSTGKVFYSVVALQLIDEGKLQLDTPIYNHMSDYQWFGRIPNARKLTVRSLMRHETGIPRYVFNEQFQKDVLKDVNKVWKPEELLSYIFDEKPQFDVGESFAYSDTNYIILCTLIEKITGKSIYEEVQKRVLDKVGLKNVVPQTSRSYTNIAQGYNGVEDAFFPGLQFNKEGQSNYNLQFEWAGGGLVITSADLAVLAKKVYEGQMFSASLLTEYLNGIDAGKMGGQWGLGVHIRENEKGKIYGHSGFMPGYITNMMYYARQNFAICYQINTSDRTRTSIMRQLPSVGRMIQDALDD